MPSSEMDRFIYRFPPTLIMISAGNVSGTTLMGTDIVGMLQTAAQPNITSIGSLSSLDATFCIVRGRWEKKEEEEAKTIRETKSVRHSIR